MMSRRLALACDADHRREPPGLAGGLHCLAHDLDVARRLERVVGAEAAGLGTDPVDRVVGRDADVGGAVPAGLVEAALRKVDRDDALGAGEAAADHGTEPDEPAAEHDAGRAWLDLGRVERGADAGREPAGERRASVQRRFTVDLCQCDLGHHRVLRERRRAHEVA